MFTRLFSLMIFLCSACFAAVREIPLEDFFKNHEYANVQLSPNGKLLSYLAPSEHRMNIFIKNLKTNEVKQITNSTQRDILGYLWCSNDKIIYRQDQNGNENYHIYLTDPEGKEIIDATPFDGVACSVINRSDNADGRILIQMNQRNPEIFDVYQLDIDSGEIELVTENPGNVSQWIMDNKNKLRLAVTLDGVNEKIIYRKTEKSPWRTVASYSFKEHAIPLFFTPDNTRIYVSSNVGRDKLAIFEFDLETGKETNCIFEHPEVDVEHLLRSKKLKKNIGVYFTTDKIHYQFFDEGTEKLHSLIREQLPNYENHIVSKNKSETKFIIYSVSDKNPGFYSLLTLKNRKITKLFDASSWLQESEMASMTPISYTARDGLVIHGYLTLPVGVDPQNLPLIINPHGGPWCRDTWGYNPEVQFLANRGFAVLQMNYRGSSGYGKQFWMSSFKQWGLAMQDDITDAANWAIQQSIADPERVAIYGASYGGYATLSGITQTPDLYAAAVDYVGVSNLFTFMNTVPPYWKPLLETFHEMVGDPEKDQAQFLATSPALNADKIKTPLFIAQGAQDPRVNKNESDQMVAALKDRGVEVEYMVKENEGHGFYNEENRFDFYRAMIDFLRKHL